MQVHKLDMINNFTRDCAAAESQANIVNIGWSRSLPQWQLCDSGRKERQ